MSRIQVKTLPTEQDKALTDAIEKEDKLDWAAQNSHVPLAVWSDRMNIVDYFPDGQYSLS